VAGTIPSEDTETADGAVWSAVGNGGWEIARRERGGIVQVLGGGVNTRGGGIEVIQDCINESCVRERQGRVRSGSDDLSRVAVKAWEGDGREAMVGCSILSNEIGYEGGVLGRQNDEESGQADGRNQGRSHECEEEKSACVSHGHLVATTSIVRGSSSSVHAVGRA
jgi:hypothetical protein